MENKKLETYEQTKEDSLESICCYIDLLGFSSYINSNSEDAIALVGNYQSTLEINFKELNSFTYFLPCSDSIFILSNGKDADVFIKDISHFLISCFYLTANEYRFPIDKEKPTEVQIEKPKYNPEKKSYEVENIKKNWYPTIFRGGVSFGEVKPFLQKGIYDGEFYDQRNLAGKAVVSAVAMEKMGRGPRLFTNTTFIDLLSNENRKKYIIGRNNISEILWPIGTFIESNPIEYEIHDKLDNLMDPAVNLWKAHERTAIGEIYFNLMKIITLSAKHFIILNSKNKNEYEHNENLLRSYLNDKKILHFYDSLLDTANFI